MKLGPVCKKVGSGATPRGGSGVYKTSGTSLIRSQNVRNDGFSLDGLAFIDEEQAAELKNVEVEPNDVLLNITGDSVARVCQVPNDVLPARVNQHVAIIRPRTDELNPRFLKYFLVSPSMQEFMLSLASAGATRKALTKGMIESFEVPDLQIEEQREIARVLGALDDKIELNRRMNETLEAMARALFKCWFVDFEPVRIKQAARERGADPNGALCAPPSQGGLGLRPELATLFPDSFTDSALGEIPAGWEVGTIGNFADVIDCLHTKKPVRQNSGLLLLQLSNIFDSGLLDTSDAYWITEQDYKKWVSRIEVAQGDCVITNVGRVGAVAQVPLGIKAAIGRNMTAIRCKSHNNYPTFLLECLLSDSFHHEISLKTDAGTILESLNVRNIPSLRFVVPIRELLIHFESQARPLRAMMERSLAQSRSLAETRDALLPKLISGELHAGSLEARHG